MDWVIVFGVLRGLKGIQRLVRDTHSHTQVSVSANGFKRAHHLNFPLAVICHSAFRTVLLRLSGWRMLKC